MSLQYCVLETTFRPKNAWFQHNSVIMLYLRKWTGVILNTVSLRCLLRYFIGGKKGLGFLVCAWYLKAQCIYREQKEENYRQKPIILYLKGRQKVMSTTSVWEIKRKSEESKILFYIVLGSLLSPCSQILSVVWELGQMLPPPRSLLWYSYSKLIFFLNSLSVSHIFHTTFFFCAILLWMLFLSTYSFIEGKVNLIQLVFPHNTYNWSMTISWVYGLMDSLVKMLMRFEASRKPMEKQNNSQPT